MRCMVRDAYERGSSEELLRNISDADEEVERKDRTVKVRGGD